MLYRSTKADGKLRALALGLATSGAVANLVNRISSAQGVVDFINIGIGQSRWPTFNVADMGVSLGATILAWVLCHEDKVRDSSHTVGG